MPPTESRLRDRAISGPIATCGEFQNTSRPKSRLAPAEMAGSPQIPVRDRIAAEANLARFVRTEQQRVSGTDPPARGSLTHPCHTGRFTAFPQPLLLERGPVMARSKND